MYLEYSFYQARVSVDDFSWIKSNHLKPAQTAKQIQAAVALTKSHHPHNHVIVDVVCVCVCRSR